VRRPQVFVTECQTAGRGRRGRQWQSPFAANLYFSIRFPVSGGFAALGGLSLAVGVAVAQALQELDPQLPVTLKWPNDLLINGAKVGGVLIELAGEMDGVMWPHIRSVVTNPPYKRPDVDDITARLIQHVRQGDIDLAAILVRSAWDCAKSRAGYWDKPFAGVVRLQFRPIWFEERKAAPIHNFQWLIWDRRHRVLPVIRFAGADL
jgi:hypothetical protein